MAKRTVVLIDDEPEPMKYYIKALELLHFEAKVLRSLDEAWEFFGEPHPEVEAVILDIMMPPGKYLSNVDHADGLRTGLFLYKRIVEQLGIQQARKHPLPVAVLTNVSNPTTLAALEHAERDCGPYRIWQKMDTSPMTFADQLVRWLTELGVDGSGGPSHD